MVLKEIFKKGVLLETMIEEMRLVVSKIVETEYW